MVPQLRLPRTRRALLLLAAPFALAGVAVAGYLVSPLFIRPTLVETPQMAQGERLLARGTFDQKDAVHKGSGTALLVRAPDGKVTVRFEDFSVTNGPDLFVYLSGHPRPANARELHQDGLDLNLGRLKAPMGAFAYDIPDDVDLTKVRSVNVYCRAFSTMFSSAELREP